MLTSRYSAFSVPRMLHVPCFVTHARSWLHISGALPQSSDDHRALFHGCSMVQPTQYRAVFHACTCNQQPVVVSWQHNGRFSCWHGLCQSSANIRESGASRVHATVECEHDSDKVSKWPQGSCAHKLDVAHCELDGKVQHSC